MIQVYVHRLHPNVRMPKFGTSLSTCFDLQYYPTNEVVKGYDQFNREITRNVVTNNNNLWINPGDRLLVPTGLVFKIQVNVSIETFSDLIYDVPELKNLSIRLHPRSGLSLKRGLVLANSEGIVDVDYQQEVFVLLHNISMNTQEIEPYERICQAEIAQNVEFKFVEASEMPSQHSERNGGFGSTGTA